MRKDVVGVVVAILVILLFFWWMSSAERTYNWSYSFAHDDDNPFGCQLFDKMAGHHSFWLHLFRGKSRRVFCFTGAQDIASCWRVFQFHLADR